MNRILKIIDKINDVVGKIASFLIVIITSIVIIEVFMRYAMNSPTIWGHETTTMLYGTYFMLSAGYALLHDSHVSVDFFYQNRSERRKAIMDLISYTIFFFPFMIVLLIEGTKFAADSWAIKETSWSVFGPPIYPYKSVVPITAALLLLQGLAKYIRKIQVLLKKSDAVESEVVVCEMSVPDVIDYVKIPPSGN